jgi:ornithine carbamoyltransferase
MDYDPPVIRRVCSLSRIFDQAENRLHASKALHYRLLGC